MIGVTYFAYGSNMSTKRLQSRVRSAQVLGIGTLHAHRLVFQKISDIDGSGKADIVAHDSECVMGVLYRLDSEAKASLDGHEGLGRGYGEAQVAIVDESGESISARTYVAMVIDPDLKPYTWYLQHIIAGAREAGLPDTYLQSLLEIEAIEDPDTTRTQRELAIYR